MNNSENHQMNHHTKKKDPNRATLPSLVLLCGLALGSGHTQRAFAQSNQGANQNSNPDSNSVSAEIRTTVQYLNSLIDTTYSESTEQRFDMSPDYASSGRAAQKMFKSRIVQFRKSLVSLTSGDFGENIRAYREIAKDKNVSESDKDTTLRKFYELIAQEAMTVGRSYQALILSLLEIEPSWIPVKIVCLGKRKLKKNPEEGFAVIFKNGDSVTLHFEMDETLRRDIGWNESYDESEHQQFSERLIRGFEKYPNISFDTDGSGFMLSSGEYLKRYRRAEFTDLFYPAMKQAIYHQMQKTFSAGCQTSECRANLFSDYSNYFLQIKNILNHNIHYVLDANSSVDISPVEFYYFGETAPYQQVLTSLFTFQFATNP